MLFTPLLNLWHARHFPPPRPTQPLAVIGDVHGCSDLLTDMLKQLPPDITTVLVGDYIDRGEESAEVMRLLSARPDLICLNGNHEDMLLKFLQDPERHGPAWLRFGGLQTLASFRIRGVVPQMTGEALINCRDALLEAMGDSVISWLQGLLPHYRSGNVMVTHAGADPHTDADAQSENDLAWGHPDFLKAVRTDGLWVVYGHVIVKTAQSSRGRIAVDTGAYATGKLSSVLIGTDGHISVLEATR